LLGAAGLSSCAPASKTLHLTNVSYDPTKELYAAINPLFEKYWKAQTGQGVEISQSHDGSGKQSRKVMDGAPADVVTLALASDIDAIAKSGLIAPDWQSRLPDDSTPYTSTIVFLVRQGNPKGIKDWDDLVKPGVKIITPNPKTSGGARWNYLAAWAYAKQKYGSDDAARDFVKKIYAAVPVLDTGARGSTLTFAKNGQGDVLLAWENDAHLALQEFPGQHFEIVVPSISILAEPPVAAVDKNVDRNGTRAIAQAYLQFLYTDAAQDIIGQNFFRPTGAKAKAKYAAQFPDIKLVTIADFGGWAKAQKEHFDSGGVFDQITTQP
jgi:sulfate transport system substrate-binding protein